MLRYRLARARSSYLSSKPAFHRSSTKQTIGRSEFLGFRSTYGVAVVITAGATGLWYWTGFGSSLHDQNTAKHFILRDDVRSSDEVSRVLSQDAASYLVKNIAGVSRYDSAQLPSNSPCEDRFVHETFSSPYGDGTTWMAWAIFDGHAGSQTADLLEKSLLLSVKNKLSQVIRTRVQAVVEVQTVQLAIKTSFLEVDADISSTGREALESEETLAVKIKKLLPAYAGSCALLAVYDSTTSTLHVACTGDSRAVLGHKDSDGNWQALALSTDQTGKNQDEIARISQEHPGEQHIAKDGRVLGLAVSRAFGDGRWKWSLELQQELRKRFYGPTLLTPKYDVLTPPYLTAEPVVTSTRIDRSTPSSLIMASDGLWDVLKNQQAVNLVGNWLDAQTGSRQSPGHESTLEPSSFDFGDFWKGVNWKFTEERTTVQDDNVAVHLIRNALGGRHRDLLAGRLAFSAPFSRHVRDDITVQVVLFQP